MKGILTIPLLVLLIASSRTALCAGSPVSTRPEAPDFGPHVLIFDPSMTDMQNRIDEILRQQERSQFGSNRYALFFKPGKYDLDVQVGFYTQVLGLGRTPDDVAITGAVRCKARWMANNNATCNFWRGVENLSVTPHSRPEHQHLGGVASYGVAARARKGRSQPLGWRLVQWWLYRGLQDRWPGEFGLAAAVVFQECRVGQLEGGELEHGVCRHRQSARGTVARSTLHGH
jgi:hypothetical protein